MATPVSLVTVDGFELEAELGLAATEHARLVLCHPHPLHGGTMRSLVISELFTALPEAGITCLRFNFRGVGDSGGTHDDGDAERHDVGAAVDAVDALTAERRVPMILAGWSFGADLALSVHDARLTGWIAIAPPLRYAHDLDAIAVDTRPKLLILGERDEIRDPAEIQAVTGAWTACATEIVPGASHFFVGRTQQLIRSVRDWVDRLVGA